MNTYWGRFVLGIVVKVKERHSLCTLSFLSGVTALQPPLRQCKIGFTHFSTEIKIKIEIGFRHAMFDTDFLKCLMFSKLTLKPWYRICNKTVLVQSSTIVVTRASCRNVTRWSTNLFSPGGWVSSLVPAGATTLWWHWSKVKIVDYEHLKPERLVSPQRKAKI